jgi:hypothetical protein
MRDMNELICDLRFDIFNAAGARRRSSRLDLDRGQMTRFFTQSRDIWFTMWRGYQTFPAIANRQSKIANP